MNNGGSGGWNSPVKGAIGEWFDEKMTDKLASLGYHFPPLFKREKKQMYYFDSLIMLKLIK